MTRCEEARVSTQRVTIIDSISHKRQNEPEKATASLLFPHYVQIENPAGNRCDSMRIPLVNSRTFWENDSDVTTSGVLNGPPKTETATKLMEDLDAATFAMSPGDALKYKVTYGIMTYTRALINTTSPLYWEDLIPFVNRVEIGSFCLPWDRGQKESDDWWTHHPDWEVFNETQAGYCFRPAVHTLKREYLTQVYQRQFQGTDCSKRQLFVTRMWSSGWSADITNLIHTMQYAHLHGQAMEITSIPWHYAAPDQAKRPNKLPSIPACPLYNMYCYFLKLSACSAQPLDSYNREYDYRNPVRAAPRSNRWLPDYIVRPQTWLRHKVFQFIQQQRQSAIPESAVPCTVVHVRRGDVLHHGNHSRRYHPISEYLELPTQRNASKVRSSASFQIHPHILLLTDDANAIVEALQYKQYHWMYIDRPRFQADEGGWERQVPSNDPIFEMTVLLGTFALVKQCQSIVYSSSGFSSWLVYEMTKTTAIAGQDAIGHYNLDDVLDYERGRHNQASKNISMAFGTKTKQRG